MSLQNYNDNQQCLIADCSVRSSIHLLFSDVASHGEKMEKIGLICDSGFTNENIITYYNNLNSENVCIYNVKSVLPQTLYQIPDCYVLVMKGYFSEISDSLLTTLSTPESSSDSFITGVNWDTKRVTISGLSDNVLGYKLVFADLGHNWKYNFSQSENRGTIYNSSLIPSLNLMQSILQNEVGYLPVVEATYYYNNQLCYTPLHKTNNRKKIVGLGLGSTIPLQFVWYHSKQRCSDSFSIPIEHGDLYIISEAAAGISKEKQTGLYLKYGIGSNNEMFN